MLNSNERMDFIIEYMSAYQEKIKMANKNGLFDAAKMFELFAIEVCGLWFGQKFSNLNEETSTYPYVDLISDNNELLVQVSTAKNVPAKIKKTLEMVRDSKDKKYSTLNKVIFFVLSNESINKVKEYSGDCQIGNISFTIKDNLITTDDIIVKAQGDLVFQQKLYGVLKDEFDNFNVNAKKFNDALEFSRNVGLKNIEELINGEYQINRSEFLETIRKDKKQYISIQGGAGSGKSVLCKKYVENESLVLYARAERFIEESNIDNIWNCCINDILNFLNGKKIVFFIDALEFIADCAQTKFELLQYLYDVAAKYQNVYILTSCRTSDKNAFIKLETNFSIKTYEVGDITEDELLLLMKKYPVINKMRKMNSYVELLKSPFYINLIVSNSLDIDNINDENSLREFIWDYIICLKEKSKLYGIPSSKVLETIEKIVFERAKKFLLGINKDNIDGDIMHALFSEGVITQQGEDIRLKYDVFEDICFEHYFDKAFDSCKGVYQNFYDEIEGLGRCVYRRYQIWISNKLFVQINRNKFLYSLIFSDEIPQYWKRQTEIGIVKSRFCDNYFEEQGLNILEHHILLDFVKNINLFAFEAKLLNIRQESPQMNLTPIGNGRPSIIRLLKNEEIYKQNVVGRDDIVKLCLDYAKQEDRAVTISSAACFMMEYYVECSLQELEQEGYYKIVDEISLCMETLYRMADSSEEWLKCFFHTLIADYKNGNSKKRRMSKDIMEWTLKNAHPTLVAGLASELCLIADTLWLRENEDAEDFDFYHSDRLSKDFEYGLSKDAEHHNFSFRTVYENVFLWNLFRLNFKVGFQWAIQFVNKTILEYANGNPHDVIRVKIKVVEENTINKYWGNSSMWLAGIREHNVPTLIGDVIFCLKEVIINTLEAYKNNPEWITEFANHIKNTLYLKSNNIALLTIIEAIGIHFEYEIPGYALDLATSIELIHWDVSRHMLYMKNPTIELLERQILMAVGMPNLKDRYELDEKSSLSIQKYVSHSQIFFDSMIQDKSYRVLDYLYSKIKNDAENATDFLQIQKMDLRGAKSTKVSDNIVMLEANITGEAEKVVQRHEESNEPEKKLRLAIKKCNDNMVSGKIDLSSTLDAIEVILELMEETDMAFQHENTLILLIASAINQEELEHDKRKRFCEIWIARIKKLFSNGSFVADTALMPILLNQLNSVINIETKNEIKKIMLDCLIYRGQNGVINEITKYVKLHLVNNKILAQAVFNTIIKLAEDEMNHQKYNANYIKMYREDKEFVFFPNMQPKLLGVDHYIKDDNRDCYNSHEDEIIDKYLLLEEPLHIYDYNMSNYDISTICYVANCGLDFTNDSFKSLIHNILLCMIDVWHNNKKNHMSHEILDVFHEHEIVEMFQREMVQSKNDSKQAIDTLFDGIDFAKFTPDAIEFYEDIFGTFLCEFFDSYDDSKRRNRCKKKILYIENKVKDIKEELIQVQLYKSLMLSITRYCREDWRKCKTNYSYEDKQFLNSQFSKYGQYHIKELVRTVYQMRMDELLPEILVSIDISFQNAKKEITKFKKSIKEQEVIVQMIILKSFIMYSDKIKTDQELIEAYENILETLIDLNYEQAAVILDEFRIH
ncbi:SMEK domain-containing protein [Extibacter muris]|uniref:SMEK domain-containing protein n=1 Tax=Extibacter muris TaxID=1796622 RepID=UPI001D087328|nr:SMEK domain-containing protein [Extibacter muris]MCB6202955.1 SMEK domain-containing protein [Extibacter muris]MCQ4663998.1 SMEK domain-containing protein [Extibacter muris]MCQ4693304.1 SMEK domain-containing protein [Extibacter muris]